MELSVSLNGLLVGSLKKDKNGGLHFNYDTSWLTTSGARPISLSLPLSNKRYSGDLVYNFFDNLLPDNPVIRNKVQARFKVNSNSAFDLLAAIGNDCVGAIQLTSEVPCDVKKLTYEVIGESQIEKMLQGYKDAPLGMAPDSEDFRISIAGAQEKTALLNIDGQWCKPKGPTPTSHIIKLPIGELPYVGIDLTDSCENEFICMALAKAFGFEAANTEVVHFGEQKTLVVERFDRRYSADGSWLMRLPQEDFCQAMGLSSAQKYQADGGPGIEQCMALLQASSNEKDRDVFFKSQILFWLLAAIDGHGKNFSLFLKPGNNYQMTPLYDIMSAYPVMSKKGLQRQKIKMAMCLKGKNTQWKWERIQPRHFISTAQHIKYSPQVAKDSYESLIDNLESAIAQVELQVPAEFPLFIADSIFKGMRERAKKPLTVS